MSLDFDPRELAHDPFERQGLRLRALDLDHDIPLLHAWFTQERARFWGLQALCEHDLRVAYAGLATSGHAFACIAQRCRQQTTEPAALLECYDPAREPLGQCYRVRPGDVGMHVFVGPPTSHEAPERGFTRQAFRALMSFVFERLHARRIVVEPDVRNDRVHVLNREMGFDYQGYVQLPTKVAALAFCTRERFAHACRRLPASPPRTTRTGAFERSSA